jgi:hypothetical protein
MVLASAVAVIGLAAPAHADATQDQAFLVAVQSAGLNFANADNTIAEGKDVCEMAKSGKPAAEVVKKVQEQEPGLAQATAARFTAIAAGVYCPDQLPGGGSGGSGGT